jgi:serine protease DegS
VVRTRSPPICDLPQFQEFCERLAISNRRLQNSLGSGVIVRSDGFILTNAHVIADADEILVAFHDGRTARATFAGSDPETDLAVIRVDHAELVPIPIGSSDDARVGDMVLAIGNPFGIGQTVSLGIISAKGRYGIGASPYEDFIQTDAAINPGNSGGALIDGDGRLIGINSMFFSRSGGSQGIGFAIPAQLAMAVLDEIVREGRVIRGWLGIDIRADTDTNGGGLVVAAIVAQSPAAVAGLRAGDRIVRVNEVPVTTRRQVMRQIAMTDPGSRIVLDVEREGTRVSIEAIAGTRPAPG